MIPGVIWLVVWQAASIAAMWRALPRNRWTFLGPHLLIMMFLFHVGPEIARIVASEKNSYRRYVSDAAVERWFWAVGPATAMFVAVYLCVLGGKRLAPIRSSRAGSRPLEELFPLWQCLLVTAPMYLVAISGRGYVPGSTDFGGYAESGITGQFLLVGIVLTSYVAAMRYRQKVLLIVFVQSVLLILLGQRATMVGGVIALTFLLRRAGIGSNSRQRLLLVAIAVIGMLSISAARVSEGRESFAGGSGPISRISAAGEGVGALLTSTEVREAIISDFAYRVDGNAYGALVLDRLSHEPELRTGFTTFRNTLLLAVPSAVFPAKLESDVTQRNEESFVKRRLGLPDVDFLPTPMGTGAASGSNVGIYLMAAFLGALLGLVDRKTRSNGTISMLFSLGSITSIVAYEQGVEGALITIRGIAVVAILTVVVRVVRRAASGSKELPGIRFRRVTFPQLLDERVASDLRVD